jgi:hypothetical protein
MKPALDALWRELQARPGDLELRAVLADALQAARDPRGEYISLSLATAAGRGSAAARKRASQLLAAHIDKWTAGIPGAIRASRRFERGFLTAVRIKAKAKALLASLDDPAWCTVEELHVSSDDRDPDPPTEALAGVLARASSLQTIVSDSWDAGDALLSMTGTFPRVRVLGVRCDIDPARFGIYPSLAMLGMPQLLSIALRSVRRARLETLLVFTTEPLREALATYATNSAVPELRIANGETLDMDHRGWLVRVRRDDMRATLTWGTGRYKAGHLTKQVATLVAAGRREIAIAPPSIGRAVIEKEAAKLKQVKIEWLAEPRATWSAP